ncbi:phage tail protein [Citrobacter sp. Cb002]|uniref:phage tail-collar fiber domain-containing protein n=1 Tax=Citrobacter sp. Cb002 TaxID=2985004 RepID=UPI00257E6711|nr:phage tail protein [Citrobacter sp. Cb002]MDM3363320.1 phage tail protein [Citrobacter sp. Cb002]
MSQTAITLAFEHWKAQQGATGEPVLLDEFVFASVPGLNPDVPIDRNEALPPVEQIVHRQPVTRTGVVNDNGVVYSAVLGADVGDFSFNWIGLRNKASGTLAMIVHAPVQQKLKTAEGQQGNVLTRSFLMEYNGAQAETGINTPAETWQIDFTARMAGMDERQRLENVDIYGAAAFFGDGYLVGKTGNQYFVTKGTGYVAGLRTSLAENQNITVTTKPVKVWLDVNWSGTLTSAWRVQNKITVTEDLADYVQNGVQHYVFAVASIDVNGNITDLRPKGTLNEQLASDALKKHEQSRNHPDATTSEKGVTRLNSAADSASETEAATPKAVKIAMDNANARLAKERNGADIPNPPLFVQNIGLQPTVDKANNSVNKTGDTMTGNLWLSESGISIRTISGDSPQFSINNIASGADVNIDLLGAEARIFGKGSGSGPVKVATFNLNNGTFYAPGPLKAGESELHLDGNVYGSAWGGWLSNWLNTKLNERATVDWASQNFATYSWTTQNFVKEVSLGAEVFYDQTGGIFTWTFKAPQGCTMTGLMARYTGSNSAHNIGGLYYKPVQRFKNGIWVTISG